MRSIHYLWMLLLFIKSMTLSAQTCDSMAVCDCATKDLSPSGIMLGHEHGKGTWKISYRYMNMFMKGNLSGTEKVDDNYVFNNYIMSAQNMQMDMHMVMAMYGFTNRFSVMAMFNYNVLSMNMNMLPGMMMQMDGSTMVMTAANSSMKTKTSGLGDTKLYAVYTLVNHNVHHLFFSEGFNIPTGNIRFKGSSDNMMYSDQRFPYMMQTGSGSFDFMPGITYLLKRNKSSYSAQVTSVIRPFTNALNYHLGNELTFNCWAAYKPLPWISGSVRIESTSSAAITGKDATLYQILEPSANPRNYGGQSVNTYLGLNFYASKGFLKNNKLSVEYGIPVYQNFNGTQLATAYTIYAGWLISF
ncbi:MAG: transporter [Bacteroidia bacterium]